MINSTVGRDVLFYPATREVEGQVEPDLREHPSFAYAQVCAAVVAGTNEDGTLNLSVLDRTGVWHPKTDVLFVQDDEPKPENGNYAEVGSFDHASEMIVGEQAPSRDLQEALARIAELEEKVKQPRPDPELISVLARIAELESRVNEGLPRLTPAKDEPSSSGKKK